MTHRNLGAALRTQAERQGENVALQFKRDGRYHDVTWANYRDEVLACAAALVDVGIQPGDRIGLLGENRVEWLFADMGVLTAAAVCVTPHCTLSARQVHFQMFDAGVRWLFVSNAVQLETIRQVRAELPEVRGVVVFDVSAAGSDAASWDDFLRRGREVSGRLSAEMTRREAELGPDDLATIMYTSGTTGDPKGVMLTHGNLLSNCQGLLDAEPPQPDDLTLGWLPLSHIYARTIDHYERLVGGTTLCLAESPETVVANLAEVQPTHMSSVPRFYEKVIAAVASPDAATTAAKLRAIFGPRIRFLSSGGAPLPLAIEKTLRDAGLPILPGYGLTESSPVISFNRSYRNRLGTVGPALSGVEVKIADDGEVLSRGPHIMKGYWKNPAATAQAIRDGWLYTGDLGSIDADGFLRITGRKKELLVLSNGKKVVPSHIEGLLLADDCIDQAAVFGEGKHYLTALLVPHFENLRKALPEKLTVEPDATLVKNPAVVALFEERVRKRLAEVAAYEQVKKFIVLPRPFSVEGGEMTVSLKLRRSVVFDKYRSELDSLYRESGG